MSTLSHLRSRNPFTGEGAHWRIAGAAALLLTLAAQHPNHEFNRVRTRDVFSMLPNWRFFAPNPAMYDYHFLYRTVHADGSTSNWHDISGIEDRKPMHIIWFPTRRADKSVFDACQEMLQLLDNGFPSAVRTPGYRLVVEHVRARVTARGETADKARGFQFALASGTGYDLRHKPQLMFVSPYVPLDPHAPSTPLTPITLAKASDWTGDATPGTNRTKTPGKTPERTGS
ncbi:DUF5819 family protein [Streptomyces ipomoeae]|uniref:Uncharacterized protein n=1 Tax=Streptomyces ipomoeae 91-03 TaxID=698759 RepID=L1L3Q2_9ACTN|nr:DUF5819 family protein [Streptomyces ipomoeae]EKX67238.1 hypothetical protein STRIP9103_05799 [Streptomyces ipomoeae 91-03]MDX2693038.1 DUF5819 family protein [Streptomyces ipomoeae]MDX2825247.1 DUF5819 family protein [Streptomyces ipomoeae]MDX2839697.1 DUF5819 family protein [Streptomyces ipomoeae]MDX2877795.1 DUF5819 family protein [Streptomyces ipomoeae]